MTKRRNFSDKFKAAVTLEALRGDKTVQEIAAKRQLHPTQVSTWKRQAIEGMASVFSDKVKKAEGNRNHGTERTACSPACSRKECYVFGNHIWENSNIDRKPKASRIHKVGAITASEVSGLKRSHLFLNIRCPLVFGSVCRPRRNRKRNSTSEG